jgi:uncharacterized protein
MMKRCFPDINVWFALAVGDHTHHRAAVAWWEGNSALAGFCRITQLGLMRLLTTASAMGGQPLTNAEAWAVYDAFLTDSRVRVFPELPALDGLFHAFSALPHASPKVWADAYLAAHAAANEATLVTFDQAFTTYGIECRVLVDR